MGMNEEGIPIPRMEIRHRNLLFSDIDDNSLIRIFKENKAIIAQEQKIKQTYLIN